MKDFLKKYVKIIIPVLILLTLPIVFYGIRKDTIPVKKFTDTYAFVPEKISKSANIQINLPKGVTDEVAKNSISFSPDVKGKWENEDRDGVVIFNPVKKLRQDTYYAVNMDTGTKQMSGDFYVVDDPEIKAIFPAEDTETHEDSNITIVFNRPMVPLTTLTEQESKDIPITITPETPGKFKWISTRNLQFIPEERLIPASDYKVEIDKGFYSIDGIGIKPRTHTFSTRALRYDQVSSGSIIYNSPIIVDFNQPVNLKETQRNITVLRDNSDKVKLSFEYGETSYYDYQKDEYVTEEDKSKIFVYQKEDKNGRDDLWDFNTNYTINIVGATPQEGNKKLSGFEKVSSVYVQDIIESITTQSENTYLTRTDFFDPSGSVTLKFFEDVDIDDSNIKSKGVKEIRYGETCKKDNNGDFIYLGSSCEKEDDKKVVIVAFHKDQFSTDENFTIDLNKIYNIDGFKINEDKIEIPLKTYSSFNIISTKPFDQFQEAGVDEIYICSTSPIKETEDEELSSYINTDGYIVYGRFNGSSYISQESTYNNCNIGEFQTRIKYGLHPDTNYNLSLNPQDVFGQSTSKEIKFKTKNISPDYTRFHNMQKRYNVTTSDRTTLTYAAENMEYLDMHICKMSPETFLEKTINRYEREDAPQGGICDEVMIERVSLPPVYWVNNYFQINLKDFFADAKGHYILTFSNPLHQNGYGEKIYDRTYVSVTDIAVGKKEVNYSDDTYSYSDNPSNKELLNQKISSSNNLYWINNSRTLEPITGATVIQYIEDQYNNLINKTPSYTDWQGIARPSILQDLVGAVVRTSNDSAIVSSWSDTLNYSSPARDSSRTYVYTDRPIYRPNDTVHIKGIDRIGFDGSYGIWNSEEVDLKITDSTGSIVYENKLPQSVYGTFSTDLKLPSDTPLGNYSIEAFGNYSYFSVEEYVPAAFKLETQTNKEEYINGDTVEIDVQADYYFGVPVDTGTVSYSVTAQDYHFDKYVDEYFNFGQGWYSCYYCGYGDDFLFRGETFIDENGRATIERDFDLADYFDDPQEEGSKIVNVSITVKDSSGRSVTTVKSFILHQSEHYTGLKTDKYYTNINTPISVRVKTVDTEGQSIKVSNIDKVVYKINWETFKRQEVDGGYYYRSEKIKEEISREKIKTDKNGDWIGNISMSDSGQYEIHVISEDGRGNQTQTNTNVYVAGNNSITFPHNNSYDLDIESELTQLEVGDTGKFVIKTPYEKSKVLITAERGTIYDYWVVDVNNGVYLHEFPIKEEYYPNVYLSALLISDDPEVKNGNIRYEIGSENKKISVDVTPNKQSYLPGEEVNLQVKTIDKDGNPIQAEISLAVADLSVLALKGNPKKNPVAFFYDGFPLSITTSSNLKNILYEIDIPVGTKGGGGSDAEDLSTKKRGNFRDTAFWEASVETDQNGNASVSFVLPDNLTTWQVESIGITKDTKLGIDYDEFTTKKDLMAVPVKPRFIVPGDKFSIGAKVFNQTDKDRKINVKIDSESLVFEGKKEDSIPIDSGESKTVYFDVVAPENIRGGNHKFVFTASDGNFVDAVEQIIPITPSNVYETVATAGFGKQNNITEYIYIPDEVVNGMGGLTFDANATLAVFMQDALYEMINYPYGCSEQLASSLSTIATLVSALGLENVDGEINKIEYQGNTYHLDDVIESGLKRVYEAQGRYGGFAYYNGLNANIELTIHVLNSLTNLKNAGYNIKQDSIDNAINYLNSELVNAYQKTPDYMRESVIFAEHVISKAKPGTETSLKNIINQLINDNKFINEEISSSALAYLSIITANNNYVSNNVYETLKNRIDIDGRGAYLKSADSKNRRYYETPIKNTALLLQAFVANKDQNESTGNVLRWLLKSRNKDGVWGSTHDTFIVVSSMVDYLKWQRENESEYTISGILDNNEVFEHTFNSENIFETFKKFIGIDEFEKEKMTPFTVSRENHNDRNNNIYYDISLKYYLPIQSVAPRDEGITINRELTSLKDNEVVNKVKVGEVVKGKLTLTIPEEYTNVSIEDMIPAGFEIVNFSLDTEDQSLKDEYTSTNIKKEQNNNNLFANALNAISGFFANSNSEYYDGHTEKISKIYPSHLESHDDRIFMYIDELSPGVYEYEYFLRALVPGDFQHLPARAEEIYFPEIFGTTYGEIITIEPAD